VPHRTPRNKGPLTGAKPPLQPKHVCLVRTRLQVEGRTRDLAMFNLAIDSKLRGCDVVALKVADVAPKGTTIERASIRQQKTGQPVRFELTLQSRQAVDDYLRIAAKTPGAFLFNGRGAGRSLSTRHYARLVFAWVASVGLDPSLFEFRSAQARALEEKGNEYVLAIQVDATELEGLPPNVGYLPIADGVQKIGELLIKKLKARNR
jgi:integrase